MTAEDVIKGFQEDAPEDAKRAAYANELFQEAIRLGVELNNQYHTPEEIREIMGRLTGKEIAPDFRLFPPFYTDFGKNITIGRDVFINSGCHFQDQGGIENLYSQPSNAVRPGLFPTCCVKNPCNTPSIDCGFLPCRTEKSLALPALSGYEYRF